MRRLPDTTHEGIGMRLFTCRACRQTPHVESTLCEKCCHRLGYLAGTATLSGVEPDGDARRALGWRVRAMEQSTESWLPLTVALNSLSRSMGQPDLYPFSMSTPALEKLAFVHALVHPAVPS
jgi:hypothetical protein